MKQSLPCRAFNNNNKGDSVKRKILAIIAVIAALFAIGISPAAAVQSKQCSIGGYTYYSSLDFNRPGNGNVTFNWWSITASPGGLPMEFRVRWFAPAGNVIYDTGYFSYSPTNPGGNPGVSRYLPGLTSTALVNAGKANDGNPTCEMWYNVPGA